MRQTLKLAFLLLLFATLFEPGIPSAVKAVDANERTFFSDIEGHWGFNTIVWGAENGIVKGDGDGTFKPDRFETEAEFLAMLINAYPDIKVPATTKGLWYEGYYLLADAYEWPVSMDQAEQPVPRGQVARILAASQGMDLDVDGSIQFLLDQKLSSGKTAATLAGFGKDDRLTRAEALSFVKNLADQGRAISALHGEDSAATREFTLQGISIGDTESEVLKKLGQPARKDASEYGFSWYIYNQDYASYIQVGVQYGKVVGLYTNAANWKSKRGIEIGTTKTVARKIYGTPLKSIRKGNTNYLLNTDGDSDLFLLDGSYTTIFYDNHQNNTVTSIQIIEKNTELQLDGFYGPESEQLSASYELELFDLANAIRTRFNKPAYEWSELIAGTARKHSQDMIDNDYFAHDDLQGESPFDRMRDDGIKFRMAGENIAAGQTSAIFAHEAWMNSHEGHREGILSDNERLGVGVKFGGKMHVYYTQNFYSPE